MTIVLAVRRPNFVMLAADSRATQVLGNGKVKPVADVVKIAVHPHRSLAVSMAGPSMGVLPFEGELHHALSHFNDEPPKTLEEFAAPLIRELACDGAEAAKRAGTGPSLVLAMFAGNKPQLGLLSLTADGPVLKRAPRRIALLPHIEFGPVFGPPARWSWGRGGRGRFRQRLIGAAARGIRLERREFPEDRWTCGFPIRVAIVDQRGARFVWAGVDLSVAG